ncbi:hypothetical protein GQ53DRAFT_746872 [Thozetella sp. PMI_491]|nr:hypothetical protein GQ53DRAFT_746872 [Thozetella sp. PMI_491]
MADEALLRKVHQLSDLELAALLCLIAREHCLISTAPDAVDDLVQELTLVATKTLRLRPVVISCHAHTTLEDFATALLLPAANLRAAGSSRSISPYRARHDAAGSYFPQHSSGSNLRPGPHPYSPVSPASSGATPGHHAGSSPQIGNVVLAKNLDQAPKAVQIQALELLRTRRIFTRTAVQTAPKQFLLMAVIGAPSGGQARVTPHLNDHFYIAHWHDPEEGFALLDERLENSHEDGPDDDGGASTTSSESVLRKSSIIGSVDARRGSMGSRLISFDGTTDQEPAFTEGDIACLAQLGRQVHVEIDVLRYQMNIISFLRMHRAVGGGVTPTATKHFEQLMKNLAPLHGLDYVTPSLVGLAAKKIYLHRLKIVAPEKERSMQWGSELAAVEAILDGVGPEDVIEDVLSMVGAPQ